MSKQYFHRLQVCMDIDMNRGEVHIQTPLGCRAASYHISEDYPIRDVARALRDWTMDIKLGRKEDTHEDD